MVADWVLFALLGLLWFAAGGVHLGGWGGRRARHIHPHNRPNPNDE